MRTSKGLWWAAWFAFATIGEQGCFQASATGVYAHTNDNGTITTKSATASLGSASTSARPAPPNPTGPINTTGFVANQSESQALTQYLKQRRLPLVGAQVLHGPDGQRAVVLYGYVGSDFGKGDATVKAGQYLNDSNVAIDNRIKIQPELLSSGSTNVGGSQLGTPAGTSNPDASSYPGADAYAEQQNEAQQYVQQQQTGMAISSMTPLLMLGLMALSAASGGSFTMGPGSFGPPGGSFGPPPYNPYAGFPPAPGPSPYGP